jgi:transcriptional regulator with XRE-family HTH domain
MAQLAGDQLRQSLGWRLRSLRLEQGLTLREAAARAQLSHTFVSMVESGSTEIGVSRLLRLAEVYGVVLADLLADAHQPTVEFVAASAGFVVPHGSDDAEVRYLSSPSWQMQPFLVRLEPGSELASLAHAGEEFIHCVSGTPAMVVDTTTYPLTPGDTLFLPEYVHHSYSNYGKKTATLVGAVLRVNRDAKQKVIRPKKTVPPPD